MVAFVMAARAFRRAVSGLAAFAVTEAVKEVMSAEYAVVTIRLEVIEVALVPAALMARRVN